MSDNQLISNNRDNRENLTTNLADIFFRAQISKTIHYYLAERMIKTKKILGLSNIFLSALSTAGIVTLIGEYDFFIKNNPSLFKFVIFCMCFLSTFIASLILYRDDGFLANTHKIAGDLYIEIRDDIIKLYNQSLLNKEDNQHIFEKIHSIRHKLDYFGRSAPQTDQRSFNYSIQRNPKKEEIIQSIRQGDFPYVNRNQNNG
ncbi:conserved hypothetical protein, membrane [Candidatus Magnetomorum sp. HK-1]|nr:conserved hypothetical protein, membrane [Candidatus Magnetomorum sp. HK-1]